MYEAMLFNVPTLIPNDWNMRINNSNKPRKIKPSHDAYQNCQLSDLPKNISIILKNLKNIKKKKINKQKNLHFSYIQRSSEKIFKLIEDIINNDLSYKRNRIKRTVKQNIFTKLKNILK